MLTVGKTGKRTPTQKEIDCLVEEANDRLNELLDQVPRC